MIITLMNKTVSYYWFVIFLSFMDNLKNAFSEESIRGNFKGKYSSGIKNYEIVVPQRVSKDGSFISHLVSHHHSKRSTNEMEYIFYKIPIGGKDYLVELTPNRKLISPGAVVEIHKENVRKDRKFFNESSSNETVGEMFRNLDIRKLENTECHFSGTVKGENISKAALSTCYGLAGFIQITKGFYTIEPVAEHDPFVEDAYPHILYETDGVENSSVCHTMGQLTQSLVDQLVRKRRESNVGFPLPMYIETLIVMDKTLINHHRYSDCENYVLTVFNMAFNLFHDASSGLMMTLTIVRIIRLEVENDEMNLKVNADAEKTLRYFQTWQYEINPGDDSHPNHHDIAVLITRVDVCYSPSSCGLLGLTTIGKACDPKLSAALCEDNGLRLGYVIAHEIGHLLGAEHDSDNSTCNGTDAHGLNTVMHPHVPMTAQTWSTCSQAYFQAFFGSGSGSCFLDEPEEHHFNVQDLLPGVMYNADFQCKHLIAANARECEMGSTCNSLNCYVPGYACIVTHKPPAVGTPCGENMWCHENQCLVVGERPGAVDGNWGEWSAWSECSRTCGSGIASSERNCDRPQPSHGGKNCIDLIRFISEEVNVSFVGKPCETGRPSFRDIQCGEFNDWIYPEDGKVHTWKAFFFHDDNPCILYCINEERQVAALRPRVVDGTMCYRGIRDICVSGICKSLPCDLHFESNAVEDACGVCHGDGTGCEFSEGMETFSELKRGVTKLVNIPSGTRNIKVEEMSPTSAKIIVRDKDTKDVYVRGKSLGMFNVPGSQAWLGMIKKNQEALNIPGPVSKPLSIWIQRLDNVTVKWSMALPADQQRKPEFAWDYLRWGPCSAKCGPGTQISSPSCMEGKAGLVEDTFCADLEVPPTKVRQCEITKCEPRWMVGDWKGCEQPSSQKKERKRVVYCIKPVGEGEGESQIVADSECAEPKPHATESCENRQKREDSECSQQTVFDIDPIFKPDAAEFGSHKDSLRRFGALSAPQGNGEIIPRQLLCPPQVKHCSPETGSVATLVHVHSPNGTPHVQIQSQISPQFYKEISSGRQIGVSNIRSAPQEATTLESGTKKIANCASLSEQGGSDTLKLDSGLEKNSKRLKLMRKGKLEGRHSNFCLREKSPLRLEKIGENSLKATRNIKHKLFLRQESKNFNYNSLNLSKVFENLNENEKSQFVELINKGKRGEKASPERTKLKSFQLHALKPKMFFHKRHFFSFFSKNKAKAKDKYGDVALRRLLKTNKEFDGSGVRRLSWTGEGAKETAKICEPRKGPKEERSPWGNPFDPACKGRSDALLKKSFCEKHVNLKEPLRETGNESRRRKKKILGRKTSRGRLKRQRKRSSRIWKKPKSKEGNSKAAKEQCGSACGTETKNYLNNLFRDAHPKVSNAKPTSTHKPQEKRHQLRKPVIRAGVLVTDKDLPENQEMDIIFDEDLDDRRKKYSKLPRPDKSQRRLTVKGQDVFRLLQELQQCSALYRSQNNEQTKIEINIKVLSKSSDKGTKCEGIESTKTCTETKTIERKEEKEVKAKEQTDSKPSDKVIGAPSVVDKPKGKTKSDAEETDKKITKEKKKKKKKKKKERKKKKKEEKKKKKKKEKEEKKQQKEKEKEEKKQQKEKEKEEKKQQKEKEKEEKKQKKEEEKEEKKKEEDEYCYSAEDKDELEEDGFTEDRPTGNEGKKDVVIIRSNYKFN